MISARRGFRRGKDWLPNKSSTSPSAKSHQWRLFALERTQRPRRAPEAPIVVQRMAWSPRIVRVVRPTLPRLPENPQKLKLARKRQQYASSSIKNWKRGKNLEWFPAKVLWFQDSFPYNIEYNGEFITQFLFSHTRVIDFIFSPQETAWKRRQ